jgi:hypothetical protein
MLPATPKNASASTRGGLIVFFSFDLVNSTRYKSINTSGWPFVAREFYEAVVDGMRKWLDGGKVWKYVGDEVLLFKQITRPDQLRQCITAAYQVIATSMNAIHEKFPDTKKLLAVKGTTWCARVERFDTSATTHPDGSAKAGINLIFRSNEVGQGQIDFLGPDIDAGFRIAKHTMRRRLVVGAELAYLLYLSRVSYPAIEEQLKIVSYEILKGVWDDRRYPILWYEDDWSNVGSTFLYDEKFDNDIVRKVREKQGIEPLKELTKVLVDHDREASVHQLWDELNANTLAGENALLGPNDYLASRIEVHCVAVCFRDDGRALIAKRPKDKRRFPSQWEFGCGQLAERESFEECLKRNYKADFGVDLEFRGEPRPIQSYSISDETGHIPGVVFVAFVTNPERVIPTKHTAIDWISPDNLPEDLDERYVPASRERLRLAAEARRSLLQSTALSNNK